MNLSELGERALRQYESVKYFPFLNEAASPYILTSDPLGYLEAWLNNQIKLIQRDTSKKKSKFLKAVYFTRLAQDFYDSSQFARMPSKGTLLYYSFINLVKVYLITSGHDLENKTEHHGLSIPSGYRDKLKLIADTGDGISIFHEFASCIGKKINHSHGLDLKLIDLLRALPEIHEIGYALNLFPATKRKFLPVEVVIRTNRRRDMIFYSLSYEKKFDTKMNVQKLKSGLYKSKLTHIELKDDPHRIHFKSTFKKRYTTGSNRSWNICYPAICKDISELNITPMLTRDGIRYYLDLDPYRLHRLSSLLAFAFYIGTVARYRPTLNEEILKGKYQSIINEAVISCPQQFFYLLVSHVTKQICAIPKANIN